MKQEIAIADIVIGDRVRKDMGNLAGLMRSLDTVGQLQAVGIDGKNQLLFGHRRIVAAQRLGWESVWFERFDNIDDAIKALIAERDENTERKEFTPGEAVEIGMRLEALEKPKAEERKASSQAKPGNDGKHPTTGSGKLPEPVKGDTRDKVAAAVGMSGKTYEKAKAVVVAAEKPDATPEVKAAREEMDRTGKVDPAFKKVKAAMTPLPPREPKQTERSFDMNAAKVEAEKAVRAAFRSWPASARQHIPTFLRQIAKGDW